MQNLFARHHAFTAFAFAEVRDSVNDETGVAQQAGALKRLNPRPKTMEAPPKTAISKTDYIGTTVCRRQKPNDATRERSKPGRKHETPRRQPLPSTSLGKTTTHDDDDTRGRPADGSPKKPITSVRTLRSGHESTSTVKRMTRQPVSRRTELLQC